MRRPLALPILPLFFLLSLLLFCIVSPASGSAGDRDPRFQQCVASCSAECPLLPTLPANHSFPAPSILPDGRLYAPAVPLSLPLRLTLWSCEADCRYRCMHVHAAWAAGQGRAVVKYDGKWPFVRVWGMQELLSVLFSLGNLAPHAYYLAEYGRRVSARYGMRRWWMAYAAVSCNTWLWSAVFHARDVRLTERLDYFCASLGIVVSFALQVIRALRPRRRAVRALVMGAALSLFAYHVSYLQFVHFDYGYNMRVSLATGALYSAFTVAVALRERRPYARTIVACHAYLWSVALFEVFDFPPWWGLLDAHAVWHGATMWVGVVFWRVMIEDAQWEMDEERAARKHREEQRLIEVTSDNGKSE